MRIVCTLGKNELRAVFKSDDDGGGLCAWYEPAHIFSSHVYDELYGYVLGCES